MKYGLELIVGAVALAIVGCTLFGATPPPAPPPSVLVLDGVAQLARDKVIAHCEDVGNDAGSFAAYYSCTLEAGLRDAR